MQDFYGSFSERITLSFVPEQDYSFFLINNEEDSSAAL
jgi:hypothetical protein